MNDNVCFSFSELLNKDLSGKTSMEIEKILNLAREKFDKIPLFNTGVCITLHF